MSVKTKALTSFAFGAFMCVCLPVGAAERDPWMQLGAVDRANIYTVALRGRGCEQGLIVSVESQRITIAPNLSTTPRTAAASHEVAIPRADVLRIGEGTGAHEILFSGRSSWADVQAFPVGPREHLTIVLKSGGEGKRTGTRGLRSRQRTQATNQSRS